MAKITNPRCACWSCQARRLVAPILLILAGVLWLLHTTRSLSPAAVAGIFLLAWGGLELFAACLPGPDAAPPLGAAHRRESLFGPLLLAVIGSLLLAQARVGDIGPWLAKYWPLLLIIWGLVRLIEFYTIGGRRGGLAAGDIFLLLAIILGGLALSRWYSLRTQPWVDAVGLHVADWFPFLGTYHYNASASGTLQPGDRVIVRSRHGDVIISAAPDGAVDVAVRDSVHASSDPAAHIIFEAGQPLVRREGATLIVEPAGDNADAHVEADLDLRLPATVPVSIEAADGDVTVANWKAPVQITAGRGDVTATAIAADLSLDNTAHGDLTIRGVGGNLSINGNGGDLTVSDVAGSAVLRGEFSGDVTLRHLARGVTFHSSRTDLNIAGLAGEVGFDLDSMHIVNASGIDLTTRYKTIHAETISGAVHIEDQHDSITVAFASPPAAPISLSTTNADIELSLPPNSQFHLSATAPRGEITRDFPVPEQNHGGTATAEGDIGTGGPAVELKTVSGNIALRRVQP